MFRPRSKLGNIKTECDGFSFASKLEAAVYQILKQRERAGEIKVVQTQDHIYLSDARIGYIPDFKCFDLVAKEDLWVEAKGFESDVWPIKKKLYKFYGPGKLEIWKGSYLKPFLHEIIIPQKRGEKWNTQG